MLYKIKYKDEDGSIAITTIDTDGKSIEDVLKETAINGDIIEVSLLPTNCPDGNCGG